MKPCPFCGAEIQNSDGLIEHKSDCYIIVHFYSTPRRDRDLKAWEHRPLEDALYQQIDKLELRINCDDRNFAYADAEIGRLRHRIMELEMELSAYIDATSQYQPPTSLGE